MVLRSLLSFLLLIIIYVTGMMTGVCVQIIEALSKKPRSKLTHFQSFNVQSFNRSRLLVYIATFQFFPPMKAVVDHVCRMNSTGRKRKKLVVS